MAIGGRRAVFLDKDGTLIEDRPYNVDPDLIVPAKGAPTALRRLAQAEYDLFVITNQSGIAHGYFTEEDLLPVVERLRWLFESSGAKLSGFYFCPHHPAGSVRDFSGECECRKPKPGLLFRAAQENGLDLSRSWFIGDILDDVEAGFGAGCRSILIDNGNETEWIWSPGRVPCVFAKDLAEAARFILEEDRYAYGRGVLERA